MSSDEIIFERRDGLGIVRLNRPKALNTLSLGMYRRFVPQLVAWGDDPAVHAIVVMGEGGRAFCAGGDVRAIYDARQRAGNDTADFFREEYSLIAHVHRFPKPYIALMNGIVMGGGAGISVNGSHRVATEKTLFAMPEVQIGLFPDVGASRFLNLCPGRLGLYLALTGRRINAVDALYGKFATHYVPSDRLPALVDALATLSWQAGRARAQIDATLARFATDPGASALAAIQPDIDRIFAAPSVDEILAALAREPAAWAKEAHAATVRASPSSLKITFRQLALGRGMNVEAALTLEYRLTQHVLAADDFFEGIRAALVDKDNAPRWRPDNLAGVTKKAVDGYFAPLGAHELTFD
ncbi:MAG: enoyl-CoA hydratase/isomerase family protein [Alphaproteobacteria bacterium]|nr:enoyl-CoA hydratase/isomerase family protein [Alphaproteobacteria bacterium]